MSSDSFMGADLDGNGPNFPTSFLLLPIESFKTRRDLYLPVSSVLYSNSFQKIMILYSKTCLEDSYCVKIVVYIY